MKKLIIFLVLFLAICQNSYATKFIPYSQQDEKIDYKNPTIEELKSCDWYETSSQYRFNVTCHEKLENGKNKSHTYIVEDNFIEPQGLQEKKRTRPNESYKIEKIDE